MLDVCLLGTSGMLPLPGRWLTSLMIRYNGSSLMIDCGEGTQIAVKQKGWSFNPIDVICFTHYHADHISGLPGLLLTIGNSDRKKPLTLVGPKGLGRVVSSLRVIAPELPFELKLIELTNQQEHLSICGYEIDAFRVNHAVICYGYSISIPRIGKFDVEKAKELGIPCSMWNKLQHGTAVTIDDKEYDKIYGNKKKSDFIYKYLGDEKMIKTLPNLKLQDNDGKIVYFDSLLPDIQTYYYKFSDKGIRQKIVQDVEKVQKKGE